MDRPVSPTRSDMLDPVCKSRRSSDGDQPVFSEEVTLRRSGCRDSGFISSVSSATDSLARPSLSDEDDVSLQLQESQESIASMKFWCGEGTLAGRGRDQDDGNRKSENGAITEESGGVIRQSSFNGSLVGFGGRPRRLSVDEAFCQRFRDPEVQSNLNVIETTDSLDDLDRVDGSVSGSLTYGTDSSSQCSSSRSSEGPTPLSNDPIPVENIVVSDSDDDSVFDAAPVRIPVAARHRASSFSSLPDVVRPCIRRERLRTCPAQLFMEVGENLRRVADDFHSSTHNMSQDRGRQGSPPGNNPQQAPPQQPPQPQPHRWFMQLFATFANRDHGGNRHQEGNQIRRGNRQEPVRPPRSNTVWYIN